MMSQWWAGPRLYQDYLTMQVMPSFKIETHVMYAENGLGGHRISLLLNLPNKAIVNTHPFSVFLHCLFFNWQIRVGGRASCWGHSFKAEDPIATSLFTFCFTLMFHWLVVLHMSHNMGWVRCLQTLGKDFYWVQKRSILRFLLQLLHYLASTNAMHLQAIPIKLELTSVL